MSSEQIRETLLKSARKAGERYLRVRGVDLEAALTGAAPEKSTPAAQSPPQKKDN